MRPLHHSILPLLVVSVAVFASVNDSLASVETHALKSNTAIDTVNGLELYLSTDTSRYEMLDTVQVTFRIRNVTDSTIVIEFPATPIYQSYVSTNGDTVWSYPGGYWPMVWVLELPPDSSKRMSFQWGMTDNAGNYIRAGDYLLSIHLLGQPPAYTVVVSFTIDPPTRPYPPKIFDDYFLFPWEFDRFDSLILFLDDYVTDPDTPDSLIVWSGLPPDYLYFGFDEETRQGIIYSIDGWVGSAYFFLEAVDPDSLFDRVMIKVDVEFSSSTNMTELDHVEFNDMVHDIALAWPYIYVANNRQGVKIVDVSDPEGLTIIDTFQTSSRVYDVEIIDDYVYAASGWEGMHVIDVITGEAVYHYDSIAPGASATHVTIVDSLAFLSINLGRLIIFNISNLVEPVFLSEFHTPSGPRDIVMYGDLAYLSTLKDGIMVIDLSNPVYPDSLNIVTTLSSNYAMVGYDDYLLVANSFAGFSVMSLDDPVNPEIIANYPIAIVGKVFVDDNIVGLACYRGGAFLFEIMSDFRLGFVGNYNAENFVNDIIIYQDLAFVTQNRYSSYHGLHSIRFNPPVAIKPEISTTIPLKVALHNAYPNPFNTVTKIEFELSDASHVRLTVYNVLGQETTRLIDEYIEPGYYSINWDVSNVASGIYFYKLQAGDLVQTKKLALLK